ncbi:MAG: ABC transporter substrate-binding protein [Mycobacteriaceae bacterium]|nr:ABC transporter substrate-binding protein [Mycobacteriaceae bacterium]
MVAACSSNKPATGEPGGAAVTVKHKFGQTTVASPPRRVVSAGFTEQDDLLALGIVPVAVTNWWGDEPFGVWPWAQPKLGSAQPAVLSLADGLQFDQITALKPDLIVATNAGVDQDSYNRLSGIAPTIPQAGDDPFFEPWKLQADTIGLAVFQADQMKSLVAAVDNRFADVAKTNQQFKGKKVLLLQGAFYQDNAVATLSGWRTDFLTEMGLVVPDNVTQFAVDDHRAFIPRDQVPNVLNSADVLIWTTESDADQAALVNDPTIKQLDATAQNRNVFTGKDLSGAIAFSSPLSLPVVADQLPPMLSKVLA